MKNFMKKHNFIPLCSLALAFVGFFYYHGASLLFFGEPEYPTED